ncbi:MAG: HdeD family acid-resistance protein [Chitinophagaceae bacterium]|nr:MAG: HdeD family acid-resistance protein [Chitinophagaceae bacterium]
METQTLKIVKNSVGGWYLLLILGIIFIIVGIWVWVTPLASFIALSMLFAIAFLVTGILEIIYAVNNTKRQEGWGWSLATGIFDLLIGIILVSRPDISMVALPFYVGFVLFFRSILAISWSIELSKLRANNWGLLLILGILGIIFSFILLWNPLFAGMTIVLYTGLAFVMVGLAQIFLSFRLKKIKNTINEIAA